jgi:hypothetical protein
MVLIPIYTTKLLKKLQSQHHDDSEIGTHEVFQRIPNPTLKGILLKNNFEKAMV